MSDDGELTLERFLRIVPSLDGEQLLAISAAHAHGRGQALDDARQAAGDIARVDGLLAELQALHGTIIQWSAAQLAPSSRFTGERPLDLPLLADLREQARPALLDAATGLFLVERLPREAYEALVSAVDSVVGER
jgi:hypothetical protein